MAVKVSTPTTGVGRNIDSIESPFCPGSASG
jgi:hypothetical protein